MSETINGTFSISFSTPGVSNSLSFTVVPSNAAPGTIVTISGTYTGNAPTGMTGRWSPGNLDAQPQAGTFVVGSNFWNVNFITPGAAGSYTLIVTGTGPNQASSPSSATVVIVGTNDFQIAAVPSTGNTNTGLFVTGTYSGAVPVSPIATWSPGALSGAIVNFNAQGGAWFATITTPLSAGTFTLAVTAPPPNGITSNPSASVTVTAAGVRQEIAHAQVSGLASSPITTAARDTTGAKLLVAHVSRGNIAGTFTPTDNKGNTYVPLTLRGGGFGVVSQLFYVANPTVGTGHTCSLSGAGTGLAATLSFAAFDQVATVSPLDVQNGQWQSGGALTISPGAVTPSQNGVLIICAQALDGASTTATIDSGFSVTDTPAPVVPFANYGGGMAWYSQPAALLINPTWTFSSASISDTACSIAVFTNTQVDGVSVTTIPASISAGHSGIAVSGAYQGNRPTAMTATWTGGGSASLTAFTSSGGTWSATVTAPGTPGTYALTVVGTAGNTATSAPSNSVAVQTEAFAITSIPGTGTQNSAMAVSGTYAGGIPTSMTAVWNAGSLTGTVVSFQITGPGTWSGVVTAPSPAATYTLRVTAVGPNTTVSAPSSSIVISAVASTITIISTPAFATVSTNAAINFNYTGPSPTGITAVWNAGSISGTVSGFSASGGLGAANVLAPAPPGNYTLTITGTGPNTATSAPSASVSVNTAGAAVLTQSFVLQNFNSSATSPGFMRVGLVSRKGDIPSTASPKLQRGATVIDAQYDQRTTWSDGSLKFAVCHIRDTVFSANESRTYDVYSVPSTSYNNTGTKTLADITGAHNFRVNFSGLTQTDNTPTTTTVGSGAFSAIFNAQAGVATRVEKYHSGAVCEGWVVWGMAIDNVGGAPDLDLKTNWYVDIWKNNDGSINSVEVGAVVTQDWYERLNQGMRRNYNASLVDGATNIVSFANVDHPYRVQWITCLNDGSNNRGRRPWVGGAMPTLNYQFNRAYWIASKLIPPYDTTVSYVNYYSTISTGNSVYVPGSNFDHRGSIDGQGGYLGRGIHPDPDAFLFNLRRPNDYATSRINAHAGLHIFYHYRTLAQRTRPGDSGPDVANTPRSFVMNAFNSTVFTTVPPWDFTADGMPVPTGGNGENYTYTFTPAGGAGQYFSYNASAGSSHAVNFSSAMYLLEGERYHLESTIDLSTNLVHQNSGSYDNVGLESYGWPPVMAYFPVPATTYNASISYPAEERALAFGMNILGFAAALTPDTAVAKNFLKRFFLQQVMHMTDSLAHYPSDVVASGQWLGKDPADHPSWWSAVNGMCLTHAARINEDQNCMNFAFFCTNDCINCVNKGTGITSCARTSEAHSRNYTQTVGTPGGYTTDPIVRNIFFGQLDPTTSTILTNSAQPYGIDALYPVPGLWPQNGDVIYSADGNSDANTIRFPELALNTPYYVVNVQQPASGHPTQTRIQLSATPGGSPVNFSSNPLLPPTFDNQGNPAPGLCTFDGFVQAMASLAAPPAQYGPGQPISANFAGYPAMHMCALIMANIEGYPAATAALTAKQVNFVSNYNWSGDATFSFKVQ